MFRRLQICTVLLAWLLATGSHWDLVQTFGWGRMISQYSRSMSLTEAVRLTFSPNNLCSVCELVRDAKKTEAPATPAADTLATKILLVFQPAEPIFLRLPTKARWSLSDLFPPAASRATPPVPPPRSVV